MNESRRKADLMTVAEGQRVHETGRQLGADQAIAVFWKYFSNDYTGVAAIRELRKLKEAP